MCIEICANSQQDLVDVLPWSWLFIELASTQTAIGGNEWERHVDVVEVKVAFASEHLDPLCADPHGGLVGPRAFGVPR
jgi:hypothetical protein